MAVFMYCWMKIAWDPDFIPADVKNNLFDFIKDISRESFGSEEADQEFGFKYKDIFSRLATYLEKFASLQSMQFESTYSIQKEIHIEKSKVEFIDSEIEDLAFALLHRDHALMGQLKPIHFLVRLWQNENDPIISRHVKIINNLIDSFNTVLNHLIFRHHAGFRQKFAPNHI